MQKMRTTMIENFCFVGSWQKAHYPLACIEKEATLAIHNSIVQTSEL